MVGPENTFPHGEARVLQQKKNQNKLKSVVIKCIAPGICGVIPSLLTLVLTLDVHDNHIDSRTIDSIFRWENPRIQFQGR